MRFSNLYTTDARWLNKDVKNPGALNLENNPAIRYRMGYFLYVIRKVAEKSHFDILGMRNRVWS